MTCPMVVVENKSGCEIDLKECFHSGRPCSTIKLPPYSQCEFLASKFYNRNLASGRPSVIIPYVNGVEHTSKSLIPQHFQQYVKLILYVDTQGELTINGIRPKYTDVGRLWGLGFMFGRDYTGRQEENVR